MARPPDSDDHDPTTLPTTLHVTPQSSAAARATAYWSAGGQTAGEQTTWKQTIARRVAGDGAVVLDVGCGQGASSVAGAIGLDAAAEPLLAAAGRGLRPVRADVESSWPLRTASVDVVCLFDVLEHVPEPRALLAQADRVLADGGRLLVALPNAAHAANRVAAIRGRTTDFTDAAHHSGSVVSDHLHRFSLTAAMTLLADAGFAVVDRHDFFPSGFSEGKWRLVSPVARLLSSSGLVRARPGLLVYEFCFTCVRAPRRLRAVPAPPPSPATVPAEPAKVAVPAAAAPPVSKTPAPQPSRTTDPAELVAGGWSDDDPRYRGYRPTPRGVRLDHRVRVAQSLLLPRPGGQLIDVGGGDGYVTARSADAIGAAKATVVDVGFPLPLAPLAQDIQHATIHPGQPLPFADGSVDAMVSLETIEHLADPDALLTEARRMLAPDGYLILSTPRLDSGLIIAALLGGIQPPGVEASARRRYGSPIGEGRPSGHLHLFTRRALYDAFAANGLRITAYREARFSSSWRQARRASRPLGLIDLPTEAFFCVYDLIPFRKDVMVVRAVRDDAADDSK